MSPADLDVGPDRATGDAEATTVDHLERRTVLGVWGAGAFAAAVRGAAADLGVAVASSADRPQGATVVTVAGPGPSTAELRALADAGLAVRPGPAALSLTEPGTAAGVLAVAGLAATGETRIRGAERIGDSYPGFVEDLVGLGAQVHLEPSD